MPCDSVAIGVVALDQAGNWLLDQLHERTELRGALMSALALELQSTMPVGWTAVPSSFLPLSVQLAGSDSSQRFSVDLAGRGPSYTYNRFTSREARKTIERIFPEAMNTVAAQLLAELTRSEMEQAGFRVTDDIQLDDGSRVIMWETEVTA